MVIHNIHLICKTIYEQVDFVPIPANISCKVWNIQWFKIKFYWETIIPIEVELKKFILRNLDMFVWMSGFQNLLAHTDFNMFVDEC